MSQVGRDTFYHFDLVSLSALLKPGIQYCNSRVVSKSSQRRHLVNIEYMPRFIVREHHPYYFFILRICSSEWQQQGRHRLDAFTLDETKLWPRPRAPHFPGQKFLTVDIGVKSWPTLLHYRPGHVSWVNFPLHGVSIPDGTANCRAGALHWKLVICLDVLVKCHY